MMPSSSDIKSSSGDIKLSSDDIKQKALGLGFFRCGIARALPVDKDVAEGYRRWIAEGHEAKMSYMGNYTDKRLDPRLLVPGVKTIVSVALNYAQAKTLPEGEYQIAAYALGLDYHDLMKQRLRELARRIVPQDIPEKDAPLDEQAVRCFCDTGPVLERYWAQKAGIGWIGRNHQLIIPHAGSMFFLGEVFLPFEADRYDEPMTSRCGTCHRCIDACPTHAIRMGEDFESDRCLSYQLIENREALSRQAVENMGDMVYGCDRCQTACPWNRFSTPTREQALQPKPELLAMTRADWHSLSVEEYRKLFKGSAVKRVKYEGLVRNITAAKSNKGSSDS